MRYIYILFFACIFSACNITDNPGTSDNYDRTILLANMADGIIIPKHNAFQSQLNELKLAVDSFSVSTTMNNFNNLRQSWESAYKSWQHIEMFNMGKAEEIEYVKSMNTYPTNTTVIDQNIVSGNYNLDDLTWPSWSSQGFPALDYMLYGLDNDSTLILNKYNGLDGVNYLNYLNALVLQMESLTAEVKNFWTNSRNEFVNSPENTSTSSLNVLTNDFIYFFEKGLRANKIGIPCGRWDNYQIYPRGVEGYFRKNLSKDLALEALEASINFFSGYNYNTNQIGESYADYILYKMGNDNLSNEIKSQMQESKTAINNLDDNFVKQMEEDNLQMLAAYDELQKVVVLMKTDLLINLSIVVDYVDADGD